MLIGTITMTDRLAVAATPWDAMLSMPIHLLFVMFPDIPTSASAVATASSSDLDVDVALQFHLLHAVLQLLPGASSDIACPSSRRGVVCNALIRM